MQPPEPQQPPVPDGWTRCHAYIARKSRFCRQGVIPNTHYCGNHHWQEGADSLDGVSKRIPCPLDPSHMISVDRLNHHLKICPAQKKAEKQESESYFQRNVNRGGFGDVNGACSKKNENDAIVAHKLARCVLELHRRVFPSSSPIDTPIEQLTFDEIHGAIPMRDLSKPELDKGLAEAINHYMIRSGGRQHLLQQASLIGQLRQMGVFADGSVESDEHDNSIALLEMGAGRGMLGLVAAGVAVTEAKRRVQRDGQLQCPDKPPVELVMVDLSGVRAKADKILRVEQRKQLATGDNANEQFPLYLNFDPRYLTWKRVTCDLAHVHVPTVLGVGEADDVDDKETTPRRDHAVAVGSKRKRTDQAGSSTTKYVVLAKHLCGAGTDLALKSLRDVPVDVLLMATCCHGACSWDDYVGRDALRQQFHQVDEFIDFGPTEFELVRRWSTSAVATDDETKSGASIAVAAAGIQATYTNGADSSSQHLCSPVDDGKDALGALSVVRALNLRCGIKGLGRACQRLLDHGRCEFMKNVLFSENNGSQSARVDLLHYVPPDVTPQNAVLVAFRAKDAASGQSRDAKRT